MEIFLDCVHKNSTLFTAKYAIHAFSKSIRNSCNGKFGWGGELCGGCVRI